MHVSICLTLKSRKHHSPIIRNQFKQQTLRSNSLSTYELSQSFSSLLSFRHFVCNLQTLAIQLQSDKCALESLFSAISRNYCITYRKSTRALGHADADQGSDQNDRISYTDYCFMFNGGAVSWTSHKSTVAHSTMEAGYMSLSDTAREAITRKPFFQELKVPSSSTSITILSNNQSAL